MARQVLPSKLAAPDPNAPVEPAASPVQQVELKKGEDGKFDPDSLNDRKYRVIKGQFGCWSRANAQGKPDVFTHKEFRRLTPVNMKNERVAEQIDPETYHRDLINRALRLGVIEHAPDAEPTPTPLGPESNLAGPVKNWAILESVEEALERREAMKVFKDETEANASSREKHREQLERGMVGADA